MRKGYSRRNAMKRIAVLSAATLSAIAATAFCRGPKRRRGRGY